VVAGDHPVPGLRSLTAASTLGQVASLVRQADEVLVLLSGGTTSLLGAPIEGIEPPDLIRLYDGLLGSGLDIVAMNAIRKRFSRWGAGRLAIACNGARVRCLIASDVIGDDLTSIGSGPCVGDPLTARELLALIAREGAEPYMPSPLRAHLEHVAQGALPETPKPHDPPFRDVTCEIVLGNRDAIAAAAERARELGISPVKVVDESLIDDAALTGARLAEELIRFREAGLLDSSDTGPLACMIWGGETTVRLGVTVPRPGGRCQELALAAAIALDSAETRGDGITILAAGTDGRDGTTDAAGAIVDSTVVNSLRELGRDPEQDLVEHECHAALDAVGTLLRVGHTGTNVGDIVIGIVGRPPNAEEESTPSRE
jgi:glycerate 2-kinase